MAQDDFVNIHYTEEENKIIWNSLILDEYNHCHALKAVMSKESALAPTLQQIYGRFSYLAIGNMKGAANMIILASSFPRSVIPS